MILQDSSTLTGHSQGDQFTSDQDSQFCTANECSCYEISRNQISNQEIPNEVLRKYQKSRCFDEVDIISWMSTLARSLSFPVESFSGWSRNLSGRQHFTEIHAFYSIVHRVVKNKWESGGGATVQNEIIEGGDHRHGSPLIRFDPNQRHSVCNVERRFRLRRSHLFFFCLIHIFI